MKEALKGIIAYPITPFHGMGGINENLERLLRGDARYAAVEIGEMSVQIFTTSPSCWAAWLPTSSAPPPPSTSTMHMSLSGCERRRNTGGCACFKPPPFRRLALFRLPVEMITLKARVRTMRQEALGVLSIELVPEGQRDAFPAARGGAHVDLHLPGGMKRSYSLYRPSTGAAYNIAVQNEPSGRGGSRYIHESLRVGDSLLISEPRNHFQLCSDRSTTVLVAGGIGITSLYAMLQMLASEARTAHIIYRAQTRERAAFVQDIAALAGESIRVSWHFDKDGGGGPDLSALLKPFGAQAQYYCCGPSAMIAAFERVCADLQYPHTYVERFAAEAASPAAQAQEQAGFEVELRRSNRTIAVVPPATVLDTLLKAGIEVDYSCKEGVCGTCETAVLAGDIEHRDSILSKAERASGKTMMVCVSRCRSGKLVLDL
jgi:ferredoxin-NADP reductase